MTFRDFHFHQLRRVLTAVLVTLALLGLRKRTIRPGQWTLKSWVSAHVWLGLSLIVIATLHCAFQFGVFTQLQVHGLLVGQ